jgi:hypothetical protein
MALQPHPVMVRHHSHSFTISFVKSLLDGSGKGFLVVLRWTATLVFALGSDKFPDTNTLAFRSLTCNLESFLFELPVKYRTHPREVGCQSLRVADIKKAVIIFCKQELVHTTIGQ